MGANETPRWQVRWTGEAQRSLKHLPPRLVPAIFSFANDKLAVNPWRVTHALHEPLEKYRSGRVGPYRLLVEIDAEATTVYIVKAAYHADIYRPT